MHKRKIAPSILSADFANLQMELDKIAEAGADWVHVDVMDGKFVNNLTIGIPVVESLKKVSKLPLDVHLMIEEPERYVERFVKAGADTLTIHVEATREPAAVLERIKELGARPGITLRPGTNIEEIEPFLSKVGLVLVMTVEPGFGGQSFMMEQVAKINWLHQKREENKYSYLIEVDGGINRDTAKYCVNADVLVAGNYVFKNPQGYALAIADLR